MATIRWCPIYPKWDSYQPLVHHLTFKAKKNHLPHLQLQAISRCCHVLGFLLLLALGHSRHLRCALRARRDAHEGLHAALAQQRQDTKEEEGQHRRASHFCCVSGRSDWKFGGPITLRAERSQRRCWKRTQFAEALTWFQSKFEDRLQKQLFKCSTSTPTPLFWVFGSQTPPSWYRTSSIRNVSESQQLGTQIHHKSTISISSDPSPIWFSPWLKIKSPQLEISFTYNLQTKKCLVIFRHIQCHCLI